MIGYWQANLKDMIEVLGEKRIRAELARFSCPLNPDVELFIREKAIEFSKSGFAATHLVYRSYQGEPVLVGYYALANKTVVVKGAKLNSKWKSRLRRFANYYDDELKQYQIALPLIGQLGKNFAEGRNNLITGDDLLKFACDKIRDMQYIMGGKMAYIECEDKPKLIDFYTRNGFYQFAHRNLDRDELSTEGAKYLVQMIKYFSDEERISASPR